MSDIICDNSQVLNVPSNAFNISSSALNCQVTGDSRELNLGNINLLLPPHINGKIMCKIYNVKITYKRYAYFVS